MRVCWLYRNNYYSIPHVYRPIFTPLNALFGSALHVPTPVLSYPLPSSPLLSSPDVVPSCDRRVVYLNPGDGMKGNASRPLVEELDTPERGAGAEVSSPWRPLCSVDRRLCSGGIGIAACLPDRLCLVVRGGAGGGIAHLVTR